jgi:2,3-bisphosphoglycerate-dependent phosphoglycerate mutase
VIAAHGNSLRALLSPEGILKREFGTGVPIIYRLNDDSTVESKLDLAA